MYPPSAVHDSLGMCRKCLILCFWLFQIDPIKPVTVQNKEKKKMQTFQLRDDTDSIRICMWGEETKQCKGLSVGDVIKVTNVKTNQYYETVSLSSNALTKIQKVVAVICCSLMSHISHACCLVCG